MKASEVIAKYQDGERNFRNANLRGQSFKGKDLSGADFSGTDIRSTNFTGANLTGAKFVEAQGGLQKRWAVGLTFVALFMAVCSGVLSAWIGYYINLTFTSYGLDYTIHYLQYMAIGWVSLLIIVVFWIMTIRKGLIAGFGAVTGTLTITVAIASAMKSAIIVTGGGVLAITGVLGIVIIGAGAIEIVVAVTEVIEIRVAVAVAISFVGAISGAIAREIGVPVILAVVLAIIFVLLSAYISRRAMKGDPRDAWLHTFAVAFAAIGGTSFHKANLTDADFTRAKLKSTDLREANITRTCWRDVEKLDQVRPGTAYLKLLQLHEWLLGKQGTEKNFDNVNLRGVYLPGANLSEMSFIGADLSEANLQDADLSRARLVQTQLDQTDLTGATLTGAFIEEWNITTDTKLDGIRCDYVFMRLPPEKRPDWLQIPPEESLDPNPRRKPEDWNRNFAAGEFADFIAPMVETLDLYHNQIEDPRLVAIAYHQLRENNPDAQLELVSVEKKGKNKDKLLLRSETKPQADHGALNKDYFANLKYLQSLPPEAKEALLAERAAVIQIMAGLIGAGQQNHFSINNQQGDNMSGDRNINTGGGNYNESIGGDYIQGDNINQSGTFGIGVNKGTIKAQNIAGNINQSSDEIKGMIAQLRKQIEALENQAVREEATAYLDDLEAEIIESPTPKQSRLKSSLTMLWNVGKDTALFANAVTALATRFNIHL